MYEYNHVLTLDREPYLFRNHLSWSAARQWCIDLGGHLMEPKTQRDVYLAQRLRASISSTASVWLGGSDSENEGTWIWDSDGSRMDMTRFWASGQPVFSEDHLSLASNGFHDGHDHADRAFICTLPAIGLGD